MTPTVRAVSAQGVSLRVLVATWGSRGDFQPYLALAQKLMERGHDVVLAATNVPEYADAAQRHGVRFEGLGPRVEIPELLSVGTRVQSIRDPLSQIRVVLDELLVPGLEASYRRCVQLAGDADVVVSHCLQPAGLMAAEYLHKPVVTGTLVPLQIPSRYRPPRKLPNLGTTGNRLMWRMASLAIDLSWARAINTVRESVGMQRVRNLAGDAFYAPKLNLVAASEHITPAPRDWAPRHRMTGFWFLESPEFQPSTRLEAFLAAGPPPIAVGFGSMAVPKKSELTRAVVDAVKRAGGRAILDRGWAGLGDGELPESVLRVDDVPHSWLLPRVSAFVHHGGAGTSAASFRAGVPSVFIPHVFDHEYWGERAWEMGVAPRPIALKELSVESLARAVRTAIDDKRLRTRVAALAETIQQEDGTLAAASLIETFHGAMAGRPSGMRRESSETRTPELSASLAGVE